MQQAVLRELTQTQWSPVMLHKTNQELLEADGLGGLGQA
jgi:hypothetical protein